MAMGSEKKAITNLLETYKCLPCLWDPNDEFYGVKDAREQAYEILLKKYRVFHEDGTLEDLKKKIENMRTAYRRECKKILTSRDHFPKLWYFKLLTFIDGNEHILKREKCNSEEEEEEYLNESFLESNEGKLLYAEEPSEKKMKIHTEYLIDEQGNETLLDAQSQVSQGNYSILKSNQDCEAESFGKTVGLQLKELNRKQRVIAEKLISEIIFYGRTNKLEFDTSFHC